MNDLEQMDFGALTPQEMVWSVKDFNQLVDTTLKSMGQWQVRGEVTEYRITPRKGVFITLKDPEDNANLSLSGYAPVISGIDLIEPGMEVVATGVPNLYVPYGKFSLKLDAIRPHGEGALKLAYDKLKAKLEAAGLFAEERKQTPPALIQRVALITADASAAYSDFMKVLRENRAGLQLDFYPVAVQGPHAVREILAALKLSAMQPYDALVLMRGGGSLEDLIAFNDEAVVQAVAAHPAFSIVGVGHERDESLADYVADRRASTPTQAAVYLYEHNLALIAQQARRIEEVGLRFDERVQRMRDQLAVGVRRAEQRLTQAAHDHRLLLQAARDRLQRATEAYQRVFRQFDHLRQLASAVSPEAALKRGYALLRDDQGKLLTSVQAAQVGQTLSVQLKDGQLTSEIKEIHAQSQSTKPA